MNVITLLLSVVLYFFSCHISHLTSTQALLVGDVCASCCTATRNNANMIKARGFCILIASQRASRVWKTEHKKNQRSTDQETSVNARPLADASNCLPDQRRVRCLTAIRAKLPQNKKNCGYNSISTFRSVVFLLRLQWFTEASRLTHV